jgi:hypothetical protein
MGSLRPGDEELHYSDSSHRWIPPNNDIDPDVWRMRVQDHVDEHRRSPDTAPPPRPRVRRHSI